MATRATTHAMAIAPLQRAAAAPALKEADAVVALAALLQKLRLRAFFALVWGHGVEQMNAPPADLSAHCGHGVPCAVGPPVSYACC